MAHLNTRSRGSRQSKLKDDSSPKSTASSGDELGVQTKNAKKRNSSGEEAQDSIVVSTAQKSTEKGNDKVTPPTSRKRGFSRSSLGESAGSSPQSSSRRTTPKKDFEVITIDDTGGEDELGAPEPTSKKAKVVTKTSKLANFRKGRSKWDNPDEMLTNQKSPLADADIRTLLCSKKAWDVLTADEKQLVLSKFPDQKEILDANTPDARPDIAALRSNDNFRNDIARYQEALSNGFHDPAWIASAQGAHRKRELGFYDEYTATDFLEKWGIAIPDQTTDEKKEVKSDEPGVADANEKMATAHNNSDDQTAQPHEPTATNEATGVPPKQAKIDAAETLCKDSRNDARTHSDGNKKAKKTPTKSLPSASKDSTDQPSTISGNQKKEQHQKDADTSALHTEAPDHQTEVRDQPAAKTGEGATAETEIKSKVVTDDESIAPKAKDEQNVGTDAPVMAQKGNDNTKEENVEQSKKDAQALSH